MFSPHQIVHSHVLPLLLYRCATRLRPIDVKYMYELGLKVPIVPIVTKVRTRRAWGSVSSDCDSGFCLSNVGYYSEL